MAAALIAARLDLKDGKPERGAKAPHTHSVACGKSKRFFENIIEKKVAV